MGRGRPRTADKYGGHIAAAEAQIADKLHLLVDTLLELAEGVLVQSGAAHDRKVYRTPPDFRAITYLLNRIMGKPTERVESDGTDTMTIRVVYADDGPDERADDPGAPSGIAIDP